MRFFPAIVALGLLAGTLSAAGAQAPAGLEPTPRFPFLESPLTIRQPALPSHPFTVTGRSGAILGMQDGTVELWQLPVKLFSNLKLRAEVEGYTVPIELNPLAAELEVSPGGTTLVYSHAAITVRQHMFVPAGEGSEGLGGIIFFEIESIHPATLTVSLTPALTREWPAPQWGQPGWDWHALGSGGVYTLGTDNPEIFSMIGMANATPGPISPYQEHPQTLPLEFRVHFDPAKDAGHLFPLLCQLGRPGERNNSAGVAALQSRLLAEATQLPAIYAQTQAFYAHFFDHRTAVHTPDARFDAALAWAELAIDKAQATIPAHGIGAETTPAETGLVAGWFPAFDSARPGFGWFFGRDTLWSLYAVDSYGDDALAREALTFLIRRQRADGKMMHEYSQTAASLTGTMAWDKLPYEYAAADGTPLFLLAMQDYIRSTADISFLKANWDSVQRAYHFERTHDSDGDGVYDNAQGTGWVEDWPAGMPHQELYLAALDRDATSAMAQLSTWMGNSELSANAKSTATQLTAAVNAYQQPDGLFAFSKNANGTYDITRTVYPSVALWANGAGLPNASPQLKTWASHSFETDWGTRAVDGLDPVYDPISYHRGSVWPLFTGWAAMAAYRSGHTLAGYAALRQNVDLTWAQDPGSVTELLSGAFYQPLGRSSTHQLWSSAMVLAPALRELFGLEPDAPGHTLLVHPHLPPSWDHVSLDHVHVGETALNLTEQRSGNHLHITALSPTPVVLCLSTAEAIPSQLPTCTSAPTTRHELDLPLPPLELSLVSETALLPGSATSQPHIVEESYGPHATAVTLEAQAGSKITLQIRHNGEAAAKAHTSDGDLENSELHVTMPAGTGWTTKPIRISW